MLDPIQYLFLFTTLADREPELNFDIPALAPAKSSGS
jgi:hypothetical protein